MRWNIGPCLPAAGTAALAPALGAGRAPGAGGRSRGPDAVRQRGTAAGTAATATAAAHRARQRAAGPPGHRRHPPRWQQEVPSASCRDLPERRRQRWPRWLPKSGCRRHADEFRADVEQVRPSPGWEPYDRGVRLRRNVAVRERVRGAGLFGSLAGPSGTGRPTRHGAETQAWFVHASTNTPRHHPPSPRLMPHDSSSKTGGTARPRTAQGTRPPENARAPGRPGDRRAPCRVPAAGLQQRPAIARGPRTRRRRRRAPAPRTRRPETGEGGAATC